MASTAHRTRWRGVAGGKERRDSGVAAVELAIVLPLLLTILFGVIDFGRAFYAYVAVVSAAHEAAVYAARTELLPDPATVLAVAVAESNGFLTTSNTTLAALGTQNGAKVRLATVRLTFSFSPLTGLPVRGTLPLTVIATAASGTLP